MTTMTTKTNASQNPADELRALRRELCHVRAQLHEQNCWERTLHNELTEVRCEIRALRREQQLLLQREAELEGRIEKLPEQGVRSRAARNSAAEPAELDRQNILDIVKLMPEDAIRNLLNDLKKASEGQ